MGVIVVTTVIILSTWFGLSLPTALVLGKAVYRAELQRKSLA